MNKIASADLYKRFLTLTSLNILSNITVPLTGIVDTAVLGHYTDPISISGVSIGTIMFDYLYWGMGFLRMGTTGTTAIKTGQGDEKGAFL
ncbi:MATE family efflux transporter, partial [Limnoraphis robusta]